VFAHGDGAEKAKRIGGGCRNPARLYGLPEHGQTDISGRLGVRCESLLPGLSHAAVQCGHLDLPAWSLIRNGLLRTQ
jgi:hypothetical protein